MQQHILQRTPASLVTLDGTRISRITAFLDSFPELEQISEKIASLVDRYITDPNLIEAGCSTLLPKSVHLRVVGTVERRALAVRSATRNGLFSVDRPLFECIPPKFDADVTYDPHDQCKGTFAGELGGIFLQDHPRVHLVALYHPENFPLPRFSLGISDIARSLRRQWLARVSLQDMQLNVTVADVVAQVQAVRPHILGVSATFGQYDVLSELMGHLELMPAPPLVVFGGSLSVRVADELLDRYPDSLVGTGDGERTMRSIVESFGTDRLNWGHVPAVKYRPDPSGPVQANPGLGTRTQDEMIPELDLLRTTLDIGGVMQLESSRGCSYACSFCPRDHKGVWIGDDPQAMEELLPYIAGEFQDRQTARRIFLVDEEFVGYRPDDEALRRVVDTAQTLRRNRFTFETSSRLDQIVRRNRDAEWHIKRFDFWRELTDSGLDRCLFGIESGVDSILKRFNKKTTSDQMVRGLRALSALDVPNRLTYITFDQLMNVDELVETYEFLSRTDLIIPKQNDLSSAQIFELICDDAAVAPLGGIPMYKAVSYMMVTMEALIGAPYTQQLALEGLLGDSNPLMGRREARFLDPRIGAISNMCQRWVDRNFSLDYTLKSLEKTNSGDAKSVLRDLRGVLKTHAHNLLGLLIYGATGSATVRERLLSSGGDAPRAELVRHVERAFAQQDRPEMGALAELLDVEFAALTEDLTTRRVPLASKLRNADAAQLDLQVETWSRRSGWELINDPAKVKSV